MPAPGSDVADEAGEVQLALDDEQLLETAREAHYQELEVNVVARNEDKKLWYATDIEFVRTDLLRNGSDD